MKSKWLIFIFLFLIAFVGCGSKKDLVEECEEVESIEETEVNESIDIYNLNLLSIDSVEWVKELVMRGAFQYSEEVKGDFVPVTDSASVFPEELVTILEEAFYDSCNEKTQGIESKYFQTINAMGADEYKLELQEIYHIFPELSIYKDQIQWEEELYAIMHETMGAPLNIIRMFKIGDMVEGDNYAFLYKSGGSNGVVSVQLTDYVDNKFVVKNEFETLNDGDGRVIRFENEYYYVFLELNYNSKQYDGMRIHKLGNNPREENLSIRYLPNQYMWDIIYSCTFEAEDKVDEYLEAIKGEITSKTYLDSGERNDGIKEYYGDELLSTDFVLEKDYDSIYKSDVTNSGIPIYLQKNAFSSSDIHSFWHLRMKFYLYDEQTDSVVKLENMSIENRRTDINLVQMWFKKIAGKVYTFCVYHLSDYNYMLNVTLIEGSDIQHIRTDIFCPEREFILKEGDVFRTAG